MISWRPSDHPLLTCGHVKRPWVHQQFAVPLLGVDLGQLREPDVIADAQAHLAPGGRERGEVIAGAQGVRLLEGHLARDILRGWVSTRHYWSVDSTNRCQTDESSCEWPTAVPGDTKR